MIIADKAIFLDRDGTINQDPEGYISSPKDFHLFPFTAEAIRIFNELEYKTIVVTNQSGIARGLYTIDDLHAVHNYMIELLEKEKAFIDLILYSPYHPDYPLSTGNYQLSTVNYQLSTVNHRKPKPGMFFEALHKFPIKASKSYMIGDKASDIEFGKTNGLTTILVKTGYGKETWENRGELKFLPDFVVENVFSAAELVRMIERK